MSVAARQVCHRAAIREQILEKLILNEIPPGERIGEEDLAMEFGVSRTPVREALILLERQKLVVNEANRGFFAASMSFEGLRSYFDMASWLFPFLFQRAAVRMAGKLPEAALELRDHDCTAEPTRLVFLHFQFIASVAAASQNAYSADTVVAGESFHCMMRVNILRAKPEADRLSANKNLWDSDCALIKELERGEEAGLGSAIEASIASARAFVASSFG